ncbi:MAG TPA: ATP-grasp domain-containing protein [Gammaproteobacteria bacterium]
MNGPDLIVVGASARAAAFSAVRAGFSPFWIDQFGDRDLAERYPGVRVPESRYPAAIAGLVRAAPRAPLIYTGAMENHAAVLRRIAALRPLLGNDAETCAAVRDPFRLHRCLAGRGIAAPEVRPGTDRAPAGRWLRKPLAGGGGLGIDFESGAATRSSASYLQRFVEGEGCSAVFVADGSAAALVGVTLQLVGRPEFHAPRFAYCGSIGPLPLTATEREEWSEIGGVIAREFGLRGLFGVDAVRDRGRVVPVEVNPRYTASVEVHELAGGPATLALHAAACRGPLPSFPVVSTSGLVGKAHLFAPSDLRIPDEVDLRSIGTAEIADVPAPGTLVRAGAPILTLLTRGDDEGCCARLLAVGARDLYQALA